MPDFRTIKLRPLTGHFDTLSSADEVGFGAFRVVKNATTRSQRNRQRGGGWRRLFADDVPYNNQDLHDQLTDHLGYYESFEGHATGGGGLSSYGYSYFASAYLSPSHSVYPHASGPFAPVYLGDFPELFYGPCPIFYPYIGYPYHSGQHRPDLYGQGVTTGYPQYYLESYVYTSCPVEYPGTTQPGYPYGPQFPMYDPQFSYDYIFCGPYLYNRPGCREAVTMLNEIVTATGRKLIAATMSRIYELNQSSGNWRVLADGLGNSGYTLEQCTCNPVRGISATLGSYFLFTNNFDPPAIYFLGDDPAECTNQSVLAITDLDALGITRAGGVVVWKGFVIFYDITEGGERMGATIIWSDLEDPNSFIESDTSFAGRATVAVGETILAAAPLGNWLILYTDKSIIRVSLVGGDDVFNFENIYKGGNALKYKYSLANCGDLHVYLGESDIYAFTQFDTRPINIDWVTKAAGMIFYGIQEDDAAYLPINKEACDLVTAGWSEEKREVWLSWPTGDNICPDVTLRLNFKFSAADFVDHGFTAFLTFRRDLRPTIGQWLEDLGVCPRGTMVAAGPKDGPVCQDQSAVGLSFPVTTIWYAADTLELADGALVDTWPDISGAGNHGTGTGIDRPTFDTNQIDGLPALRFPAVQGNEHIDIPNILTALTAGDMFIVCKQVVDPPSGLGNDAGGVWALGSSVADDYLPFTDGIVYMGAGSTVRKTVGNLAPSFASWRLWNVSSAAGSYICRLDGTEVFNTAANAVGFTATPWLGRSIGGKNYNGWIAEFILFDRILTADERAAVVSYLGNKYPSLNI